MVTILGLHVYEFTRSSSKLSITRLIPNVFWLVLITSILIIWHDIWRQMVMLILDPILFPSIDHFFILNYFSYSSKGLHGMIKDSDCCAHSLANQPAHQWSILMKLCTHNEVIVTCKIVYYLARFKYNFLCYKRRTEY